MPARASIISARQGNRLPALRAGLASLVLAASLLNAVPAGAVNPDEMLPDPELEARARALSLELRCVVCRNQNIDDSNAALARDLRILLRERLSAGDSDQEAIDYLVSRYGNYILLKPPVNGATALLWAGPAALLLIAAGGFWAALRRRSDTDTSQDPTELDFTEEERAIVAAALENREP